MDTRLLEAKGPVGTLVSNSVFFSVTQRASDDEVVDVVGVSDTAASN